MALFKQHPATVFWNIDEEKLQYYRNVVLFSRSLKYNWVFLDRHEKRHALQIPEVAEKSDSSIQNNFKRIKNYAEKIINYFTIIIIYFFTFAVLNHIEVNRKYLLNIDEQYVNIS